MAAPEAVTTLASLELSEVPCVLRRGTGLFDSFLLLKENRSQQQGSGVLSPPRDRDPSSVTLLRSSLQQCVHVTLGTWLSHFSSRMPSRFLNHLKTFYFYVYECFACRYAWYLWRSGKDTKFPRSRVANGCELPHGC